MRIVPLIITLILGTYAIAAEVQKIGEDTFRVTKTDVEEKSTGDIKAEIKALEDHIAKVNDEMIIPGLNLINEDEIRIRQLKQDFAEHIPEYKDFSNSNVNWTNVDSIK